MTELMTIGYEGLTTRDFIDLLRRCRVSMIVDIRELPISRKPGFAKAALAAGEGGAHAILGAAYFKVGRFEDAVREYGEALRLEPSNPALARRVEIARRAAGRRAEGASP